MFNITSCYRHIQTLILVIIKVLYWRFFYIQNQKIGQMKSKKLFISVRFILEPLYIVRFPPKFIGQKNNS
ncbi:hypothetical protein D7P23_04040 [Staphylococcus aureus]|nr:hypothetical protein C7Q20_13635 [Staphylococcus aureus]PZK47458.1 hypothetical protein C7Q47_02735 [Staphylococcus aureus]PZK57490.1 hypothetical protein C7Q50_12420 [Staphylococcus aureus]PZL50498.1 hypothetical protein C7P91_11900 [Staphylococcus aureus]QFK03633.1 hypothetical protein DQV87_04175 [Staphylococcus aureus]